ncbi:MAG: 3,4-dehydroadipyl-CoA semialdehyde dehydrogenase [Myxococcales bacterium]|jgi:oxepin-CoA hydrolase/3-oxo-5,6-dehydrosuberyl-CoA semialdehyde dehydrogenase|nr:3,4-dehydroadipyl-CoA semialdehyde dehydrogenase [Myxococcales bacterium]
MMELKSYVGGKWVAGTGKHAALVNPATEEEIARASTEGVDMKAALSFARDVGGKSLRAMTFRQRGEMLRAMSKAIHAKRDELIGLAVQNGGNTRSDGKFDIDGAWGTLAAYADLAAELPDGHVLPDGDGVQLGRSPRLWGDHVFLPRVGAAVHVNAFNFPAWGLAEKAATALLAGMPVVSKPATSTGLVAHRIVELLVESGAMPEGALSFLCAGAGDLLDHVGGQDVLAFTGGSSTGQLLRAGKGVIAHSVRVNVEADSLNAAVLGPDVEVGSDVWNLFLADVARDVQQKTGQKCTAIRRVYAPKDRVAEVVDALKERLSAIKVGDPSHADVTMGPVATAQQKRDVLAGIDKLASAGKVVFGTGADVTPIGGQKGKGFFVSPTLLVCEAPSAADAIHNHEVFGPVATVMPYDGTGARAAELVSWGGGGLVSSVYSDDKEFLAQAVLGLAPFHGRVTIGSSKIAAQAVPPGTVMPQLIHGGPGRAGGGEELGGRRGLAFYMQRVALQGDRAIVEALAGRRA